MPTYGNKNFRNIGTGGTNIYQRLDSGGGSGGGIGGDTQLSILNQIYDKTPRIGALVPGLNFFRDTTRTLGQANNATDAMAYNYIVNAPTAENEWLLVCKEGMHDYGPVASATRALNSDYQTRNASDGWLSNGTTGCVLSYPQSYNGGGYVLQRGSAFKYTIHYKAGDYGANMTAKWRGTVNVVDQVVFSGGSYIPPGTNAKDPGSNATTIDLSPYVGTQSALVRLIITGKTRNDRISNGTGEPQHGVLFRRPGDTFLVHSAATSAKSGMTTGYVESNHSSLGQYGYQVGAEVLVPTDSLGRIEMWHMFAEAEHNVVLDSWMPMTAVNSNVFNGDSVGGYTAPADQQYARGTSLGGNTTTSSDTTAGSHLVRINCGAPNSLVILLVKSSSSTADSTYFRCPYDPITPYFALNYHGGMNMCTRSTGDVGGYVAVLTDADGYVDAMSYYATNLNVYHVGTASNGLIY